MTVLAELPQLLLLQLLLLHPQQLLLIASVVGQAAAAAAAAAAWPTGALTRAFAGYSTTANFITFTIFLVILRQPPPIVRRRPSRRTSGPIFDLSITHSPNPAPELRAGAREAIWTPRHTEGVVSVGLSRRGRPMGVEGRHLPLSQRRGF